MFGFCDHGRIERGNSKEILKVSVVDHRIESVESHFHSIRYKVQGQKGRKGARTIPKCANTWHGVRLSVGSICLTGCRMSVVMRPMENTSVIIASPMGDRESAYTQRGSIYVSRISLEAVGGLAASRTRPLLNHRSSPRWKQFVCANKFKTAPVTRHFKQRFRLLYPGLPTVGAIAIMRWAKWDKRDRLGMAAFQNLKARHPILRSQ